LKKGVDKRVLVWYIKQALERAGSIQRQDEKVLKKLLTNGTKYDKLEKFRWRGRMSEVQKTLKKPLTSETRCDTI